MQPATRGRRGDHVAGPIDDIEVHGVAAARTHARELALLGVDEARIMLFVVGPGYRADRRLAGARGADRNAPAISHAHLDALAETFDRAGAKFQRGAFA